MPTKDSRVVIGLEQAKEIVNGIVYDLSDRRGLKQEWNSIDSDIRKTIIAKWVAIVQGGKP